MLAVSLLIFTMMALTRANNSSEVLSINRTVTINEGESCPLDWEYYNGRCFYLVSKHLTWAKAQSNCQLMDTNLVSTHNIEEYQKIKSIIENHAAGSNIWIGGSDCQEPSTWFWIDGTPFNFQEWCSGQRASPGQNCIRINYGGGKCWDTSECNNALASMCVKPVN